jgi:phosphoglucomutase
VEATDWIEARANELIKNRGRCIKRLPYENVRQKGNVHEQDFMMQFIRSLSSVVDMKLIRDAGIRIGADPMGGAGTGYWAPLAELYGLE